MQERRQGVNPLPVVAKARCSTSPKASSSDCAATSRRGFMRNSSTLHSGCTVTICAGPALVAAAGGGTAGADADAAATVRQCWGDLLESIASEQY